MHSYMDIYSQSILKEFNTEVTTDNHSGIFKKGISNQEHPTYHPEAVYIPG